MLGWRQGLRAALTAPMARPPLRSLSNAPPEGARPPIFHLRNLADNEGARKKAKRVGRGPGSGRGKTATRGTKGAWARGSLKKPFYEGGQTPLFQRIPKKGAKNARFAFKPTALALSRLLMWVNSNRLDASRVITLKDLRDSRCCRSFKQGIKLVGKTKVDKPINIEVTAVSAGARKSIEEAGGTVKTVYYNRLGLHALLHPLRYEITPRPARPPPKLLGRFDWPPAVPEEEKEAHDKVAAIRAQWRAEKAKRVQMK
jgi:large subunit ribosomal protein L15